MVALVVVSVSFIETTAPTAVAPAPVPAPETAKRKESLLAITLTSSPEFTVELSFMLESTIFRMKFSDRDPAKDEDPAPEPPIVIFIICA